MCGAHVLQNSGTHNSNFTPPNNAFRRDMYTMPDSRESATDINS